MTKYVVVSNEIFKKALDKKRNLKRVRQCLDVELCPNCGDDLNKCSSGGALGAMAIYKCPSCDYTNT